MEKLPRVPSSAEQQPREEQVYIRQGYFHRATNPSDRSYLIGSKCRVCGYISFPKRLICPVCIKENTMQEVN